MLLLRQNQEGFVLLFIFFVCGHGTIMVCTFLMSYWYTRCLVCTHV
jgi:hypothetical protein